MKIPRRHFLPLILYAPCYRAFSCVGPESFVLPYSEKKSILPYVRAGAEEFLNRSYGEHNWRYDDNLFIKVLGSSEHNGRIYLEHSARIRVEIGALQGALSEGNTKLIAYAEEHIPVVYRGVNSKEKNVFEIARFEFSAGAQPYVITQLNLAGTNEARLFCVFTTDRNNVIHVAIQPTIMYTGNNCTHTTYSKDFR